MIALLAIALVATCTSEPTMDPILWVCSTVESSGESAPMMSVDCVPIEALTDDAAKIEAMGPCLERSGFFCRSTCVRVEESTCEL